MKKIILSLLMLMAAGSVSRADAVTFEATVNSSQVSLDEVLQLTLTVTGINKDLDPINLPVLDGFSVRYLGPSTNISIINGDYHSERSFIYNLFPNKVGHFQIPAISATIGGQTYTTKPIDIEVSSGGTSQNQAAPQAENLKSNVLLTASVGATQVYLNQQVPLSIKLLVNGVPMRDIQYPQFSKDGFLADDFEKPVQSSEVINGVRYDTIEFKVNVYPGRPGDLTLGPVQVQGNVLYKTGQSNPLGQDNDFFGAGFNNLFDPYTARPVTVSSQAIQLHVSPLPQVNRPADFSGGIGQFDFQAQVSPLQVKAGDPLTLKMDITGSGNFKSLKMPVFQAAGFKTYEPRIKGEGDEKTAEEVIIPTSVGIKEVPALHFSYFDTSASDYKTVTQGPFAIQVTAPNPGSEFKAVGFSDISKEPSVLPANHYWENILKKIYALLKWLCASVWFWVSLGIVAAAGIASVLWRRFQDRLQNDPAFARRLKAVSQARQALGPADDQIKMGQTKAFYGLLSKVLRDYLANKWHQSSAALGVEEIVRCLREKKVEEPCITQIKTLLEQCDMACFAGAAVDSTRMRADLSQVQDLIARLEKSL